MRSDPTLDLLEEMSGIRAAQARLLEIIAEMDASNLATERGYSGLAAYLMDTIRVSRKTANRLIKQAQQIALTVTPTGHTTPAALPMMRAALLEGAVDLEHLDVVVEVFKHMPEHATVQDRELVETTLTADARETHPNAVRRLGEQIIARIDQDGAAPKEEELAEPRNLLRYRRTAAGRFVATLDIEPEAGEQLEDMLTVLGKPQKDDLRTHPERMGDAFAEIVHLASKSGD